MNSNGRRYRVALTPSQPIGSWGIFYILKHCYLMMRHFDVPIKRKAYNAGFSNPSAWFCFYYLVFTINRRETGYDGRDISFLAIDTSGGVLGSAFAALEDDALRLDSIQTNPPLRNRGIGNALIAAVIGWGQERGAARITGKFKPDPFSKPEDVGRFYAKHGISVTQDGNLEGKL